MLKIEQVILVEGKYDAARLANLVEAVILTTDGFRVIKDLSLIHICKIFCASMTAGYLF